MLVPAGGFKVFKPNFIIQKNKSENVWRSVNSPREVNVIKTDQEISFFLVYSVGVTLASEDDNPEKAHK